MTEESRTEGIPSNEESFSSDVSRELHNLRQNLKEIYQSAWESEERYKLQQDIEAGFEDFASSINRAVDEFKRSPTGQQLKSDVEDFSKRVKEGEVEEKARDELASVLRRINSELEKVSGSEDSAKDTKEDVSEES